MVWNHWICQNKGFLPNSMDQEVTCWLKEISPHLCLCHILLSPTKFRASLILKVCQLYCWWVFWLQNLNMITIGWNLSVFCDAEYKTYLLWIIIFNLRADRSNENLLKKSPHLRLCHILVMLELLQWWYSTVRTEIMIYSQYIAKTCLESLQPSPKRQYE